MTLFSNDPKSRKAFRLKATLIATGLLFLLALGSAASIGDPRADRDAAKATAKAAAPLVKESAPKATEEDFAASRQRLGVPRGPEIVAPTRLITGLLIVLALAGVVLVIGKKFFRNTRLAPKGERQIEIVDALPLGPKRQVYVLNVSGRRLVVGAAGDSMTLLSEFNDEEIDERIALAQPAQTMRSSGPSKNVSQPVTFEELVR